MKSIIFLSFYTAGCKLKLDIGTEKSIVSFPTVNRAHGRGLTPGIPVPGGVNPFTRITKSGAESAIPLSDAPVAFVVEMIQKHNWSQDGCVGYARLHILFRDDEMVYTKRSTMTLHPLFIMGAARK